ncbi:hypothetical protein N9891_01575 [bacterium]|nr:hypothetical protein [bacterium]
MKRMLSLVSIALLLLVYGGYRLFNPYDDVAIKIEGIPPDTTFVCLVADSENRSKTMEWSLAKVLPFSMHPDNCIVSSLDSGETTLRAKVRWIDSKRVGVLRKTTKGEWNIAWFGVARSEPRHRSFLFGGGSVTLDVSRAVSHESMTVAQLRSFGMDYSLTHD